ncbi:MAG: PilZ domain-containing protein [Syntrophorhabdaceae bacterium]|nr:PilZ domain-containing protein [Syntrophorhabdaceae bacterium]
MKNIKPGLIIKVMVDAEEINKISEARGSIIYDVMDEEIIIGQTDPPISESRLNQSAIVTFVIKEKKHKNRYRFNVRILEIIKKYRLSSMHTVQAIKLLKTSEPEPHNLRMSYRVELPHGSGIEMFIYGIKVNIIDISLGGARISHNRTYKFEEGTILKVTIIIERMEFEIDALVVRKWLPQDPRYHETLEFMALEFLSMNMKLQNILARKILEIQRTQRYRELFNL